MKQAKMQIPILMFHGVSDDITKVPYGFLLQQTDQFERCMRYLSENRFTTISLLELYEHLRFNKSIPDRSIVLTFDDGYLDNWVFVYPILKQHDMKGTLFINPEFVDPTTDYRPNLDDVKAKRISRKDLKWWGYLSWDEMREMENNGVMDIQSHTLTHTWYFCSDKIIDFHHPNDDYPWLAWNEFPEKKCKWVDEPQNGFIPYGTPVYEYGRSLGVRRYFDDPGLRTHLAHFVQDKGENHFFRRPEWKQLLWNEVRDYRRSRPDEGRFETTEEYETRLGSEIVESKRILERNLRKQIRFLCWPGGAYTQEAYDLAMKVGYLSTTKGTHKNGLGGDVTKLHRVASYLDNRKYSTALLKTVFLPFFILVIKGYREEGFSNLLLKVGAVAVRTARWLSNTTTSVGSMFLGKALTTK